MEGKLNLGHKCNANVLNHVSQQIKLANCFLQSTNLDLHQIPFMEYHLF
jgi:hypothetical protein